MVLKVPGMYPQTATGKYQLSCPVGCPWDHPSPLTLAASGHSVVSGAHAFACLRLWPGSTWMKMEFIFSGADAQGSLNPEGPDEVLKSHSFLSPLFSKQPGYSWWWQCPSSAQSQTDHGAQWLPLHYSWSTSGKVPSNLRINSLVHRELCILSSHLEASR